MLRRNISESQYFYPRPPRGGRPASTTQWGLPKQISIHALREEGDQLKLFAMSTKNAFLSTPSARRATWHKCSDTGCTSYFYPRPPRGGRQLRKVEKRITDVFLSTPSARRATIHAGGFSAPSTFLSTPSARRATSGHPALDAGVRDFYPRPPRGGRPEAGRNSRLAGGISIHALREEGDRSWPEMLPAENCNFYPRPPRGGRPNRQKVSRDGVAYISIHALREEGDPQKEWKALWEHYAFLSTPSARRATQSRPACDNISLYFYPRPPRGGRPATLPLVATARKFLSTPSARRATSGRYEFRHSRNISIHALREEGDLTDPDRPAFIQHFYPRPPRGGRPKAAQHVTTFRCISIHALREEGDCKNGEKHLRFCFIIKRSAQIWKSLSKNIRKKSRDLHRTA